MKDSSSMTNQSQQSSSLSPNVRASRLMKSDFHNQSSYKNPAKDDEGNYILEESKRMVDKIFQEGDIVIPLAARKDFKMIFQDQFGKEYQQNLTNADLVFYNEFHEKFKQKEYTYYKKKIFMQKKFLISQYSKNPYQYCGRCYNSFKKQFWLFEHKFYCYFCLDYCCHNCLSNEKTLIPNEFQLRGEIGKYTICKDAYEFLSKFQYVKIDKCNPLLVYTDQLKRLMVLRRKVHKVFDLI